MTEQDTLRVGIVGFGFMGRMHYRCWRDHPAAEVVAICDANPNIVAETEKAVGNIAGAADRIDFDSLRLFTDLETMLESEQLDAISLTLPTFLHPDSTIRALAAGLHVLCEKPMALSVEQCKRMMEAARRSGRILQIGHCLRFWPEYDLARRLVRQGRYGRLLAASFRRLGSPPAWGQGWFFDETRSGGMVLDLHIHDTDYVQYLLGLPQAVQSYGMRNAAGSTIHIVTHYFYPDGPLVTAEGGWAMTESFGFEMSFNLVLEKASIIYDCTRGPSLRICPADEPAPAPPAPSPDGYVRQVDHFVRRIRREDVEPVITLEQSRDSVAMIEAEKISLRTNNKVSLT
ncbi:MAG: Gfo/Idh/MocA family oxidoreductase [Sedimentisphaerales bacterium]|nr:Gfo/Idh/MocA family oxidoreductase [Sedimentisphaerales bacterium]